MPSADHMKVAKGLAIEKSCSMSSDVVNRRIRDLGWLTIALAVAPAFGLLLTLLLSVLDSTPKQHSPWGDIGIGQALSVLAFLAVLHVPYTILLCLTARGLFQHRPWARILTLVLTPFALGLMLLFGGGIADALYNVYGKGVRDVGVKMSIVAFTPVTLASAAYCLFAHRWLWNPEVRAAFCSVRTRWY